MLEYYLLKQERKQNKPTKDILKQAIKIEKNDTTKNKIQ